MKELIIEAKVENLEKVLTFVTEELEAIECSAKLQTQINIAVEEVFVNIVNYAYNPEVGGVTIRLVITDDEVTIEFEDKGKSFNPLLAKEPNITLDASERDIGGLGIMMVKKIMDKVEYQYKDNKNLLIIKKEL